MSAARLVPAASLVVLLGGTAALYLVGLDVSGWGNTYYAAAAQAGATSWEAFFYGASDAPATITVDKPPASLWLMALSVRAFGLSSFAVLLPQALLGVGTVALVYAAARRRLPWTASWAAGAIAALTPVSALMFRYDNPDALLAFLAAALAYAGVRALEHGRAGWLVLAGSVVGMAFLTKQLQALLLVPALLVVYLVAAPVRPRRRVAHVALFAASSVVTAGWWVAIVELTPSGSRPYIGGSRTDSFLELTLGYNGLGRLLGGSGNGTHGLEPLRLLSGSSAAAVSWLLPAAAILVVGAVLHLRRARRSDLVTRALALDAGTLLVGAAALTAVSGIYHSYYTIVIVPALALTVATAGHVLWTRRAEPATARLLVVVVGVTVIWAEVLLAGAAPSAAAIRIALPVLGGIVGGMLLARGRLAALTQALGGLMLATALLGPLATSIATAQTAHGGSGPVAGQYTPAAVRTPDDRIVALLTATDPDVEWVAATSGSTEAARYQLASGRPVIPIGGYKRNDPAPTLAQFQALVRDGRVHWYLAAGGGDIAQWVAATFPAQQIGATKVFDLTAPASGGAVNGSPTVGARVP